ncbi:hypothetical protein BGZ58_008944 [Dissophora ornata]|nr:hypothetical protein BGZ58_008944 [Dissophora ornata]
MMEARDDLMIHFPSTRRPFVQKTGLSQLDYAATSTFDLSNRFSTATPPVFGNGSGLHETGMDVGVAVVFSVNPPSPLESDLCADDQESILRTWYTGGSTAEQSAEGSGTDTCTKFEPDAMDHGFRTTSTGDDSRRSNTQGSRSFSGSGASGSISKGEAHGTKGDSRRSASGEGHRKSELYKTELCISVNTGVSCKYGENCQFAHSAQELQHVTRHPRYKTQMCTSFQSYGYCKYNERCTFIHRPEETRVPLSSGRRGSLPEKSTWPTSTSNSTSGSGTITPVPEFKSERLRAMSDPGPAIADAPKVKESAAEGVRTGATPSHVLSHALQGAAAIAMEVEGIDRMNGTDAALVSPIRRQQRRTLITQSSELINNTPGTLLNHRDLVGLPRASLGHNVPADAPYLGGVDFKQVNSGLSSATMSPSTAITQHISLQHNFVNPWREDAEVDDDEKWASKLAYYISTPQNDFEM